jgi:hypothetical protein
MSGKELSKLVAFVKGTQFDLVVREACVFSFCMIMFYCEVILRFLDNYILQEYLQRERYGSARLENFASGLELIGQKAFLKTLQYLKSLLLCCLKF